MSLGRRQLEVAAALLSLASATEAATDGALARRSTGDIVVRLKIDQGIQITRLRDIHLRVHLASAQSSAVYAQRFCVRSNFDAFYRLTAFSDGGGSAPFTLTSPGGDTLRYWLTFTGRLDSDVLAQLEPAVPSPAYPVRASGIECDGEPNAQFKLTIPASELLRARDSEYAGFLQLSVAIE